MHRSRRSQAVVPWLPLPRIKFPGQTLSPRRIAEGTAGVAGDVLLPTRKDTDRSRWRASGARAFAYCAVGVRAKSAQYGKCHLRPTGSAGQRVNQEACSYFIRVDTPWPQGRASSTMLNGVSTARRMRVKPPAVSTSRKRASPACAPRAAPTSCLSDAGTQIAVENA